MNNFELETKRAKNLIFPHKKIALDELRQIDGPLFELNGIDLTFDQRVIDKLNAEIGTSRRQLEIVRNASGNSGEVNFRNFLSVAQCLAQRKEVVIIADPTSKKIINVIIPKNDFIPIDQYFDFACILMEEAGYEYERMNTSLSGAMETNIYMQSQNPTTRQFAPGEETMIDGAFLQWTGDSIVLGNYYTRLICSNGATEIVERKRSTLTTFSPQEVKRIIKLARSRELQQIGFENYRKKALESMDTFCSLRELRSVSRRLVGSNTGLTEESVETIVPLKEYEEHFKSRGIDTKRQESVIKTGTTIWQLYNNLTDFASHTELLPYEDSTRHVIMNTASDFMKSKHDIQQYIEYV